MLVVEMLLAVLVGYLILRWASRLWVPSMGFVDKLSPVVFAALNAWFLISLVQGQRIPSGTWVFLYGVSWIVFMSWLTTVLPTSFTDWSKPKICWIGLGPWRRFYLDYRSSSCFPFGRLIALLGIQYYIDGHTTVNCEEKAESGQVLTVTLFLNASPALAEDPLTFVNEAEKTERTFRQLVRGLAGKERDAIGEALGSFRPTHSGLDINVFKPKLTPPTVSVPLSAHSAN